VTYQQFSQLLKATAIVFLFIGAVVGLALLGIFFITT